MLGRHYDIKLLFNIPEATPYSILNGKFKSLDIKRETDNFSKSDSKIILLNSMLMKSMFNYPMVRLYITDQVIKFFVANISESKEHTLNKKGKNLSYIIQDAITIKEIIGQDLKLVNELGLVDAVNYEWISKVYYLYLYKEEEEVGLKIEDIKEEEVDLKIEDIRLSK